MSYLGNIIVYKEQRIYFLSQIYYSHQNEGQGDISASYSRNRGEEDHHKNDTGGAKQCRTLKKCKMDDAGNEGGNDDGDKDVFAFISALNDGAEDQKEADIAEIMKYIRMTQNVKEKSQIGKGVGKGGAVHAEKEGIGGAV